MKIGYARVSTKDQNLNWAAFRMQIDALKKLVAKKSTKRRSVGAKLKDLSSTSCWNTLAKEM